MVYTKQELINAFCEAQGCQESDLPNLELKIQENIDRTRSRHQEMLDNLPITAKESMKKTALNHLNKQANEQVFIDNENVNL